MDYTSALRQARVGRKGCDTRSTVLRGERGAKLLWAIGRDSLSRSRLELAS